MARKFQGETLLIVENDDVFREQLSKVMRNRGFDTITASGLREATEAIKACAPTFAVIDLHLDDGSGLEVIEVLKAYSQDARAVILTGYGNTPTAVAAVKLGATDYLAKPADADEIIDALLVADGVLPPAPENPISPEEAKRVHIERFLERTDGNITKTARLLKMHRRTLQRILKRTPDIGQDSG
ncbi:response regulator transcription factor [Roseovarius rhodophyticola]|uniref:Response regulator n=1 Tax=Roseovarius rhodophyticola TaxID=3080827 RepID=A0ABZ2TG49_9RHOB|nr:response regulator [Roseovarius sp. W115]MDV2928922.1 response regulator [Roseovarius sp. W115]